MPLVGVKGGQLPVPDFEVNASKKKTGQIGGPKKSSSGGKIGNGVVTSGSSQKTPSGTGPFTPPAQPAAQPQAPPISTNPQDGGHTAPPRPVPQSQPQQPPYSLADYNTPGGPQGPPPVTPNPMDQRRYSLYGYNTPPPQPREFLPVPPGGFNPYGQPGAPPATAGDDLYPYGTRAYLPGQLPEPVIASMQPGMKDIYFRNIRPDLRGILEQQVQQSLPAGLETPSGIIGTGAPPTIQDYQTMGSISVPTFDAYIQDQIDQGQPAPTSGGGEAAPVGPIPDLNTGGNVETSPGVQETVNETEDAVAPSQTDAEAPLPNNEGTALAALLDKVTALKPGALFEIPVALQRAIRNLGTLFPNRFSQILKALGFRGLGDIGVYGFESDWYVPDAFEFSDEYRRLMTEDMSWGERLALELLLGALLGGSAADASLMSPAPGTDYADYETKSYRTPSGDVFEIPQLPEMMTPSETPSTGA